MDTIWTIALFAMLIASALVLTPVWHQSRGEERTLASALRDKWME